MKQPLWLASLRTRISLIKLKTWLWGVFLLIPLWLFVSLIIRYQDILMKMWADYKHILLPVAPLPILLILILWIVPKISTIGLRSEKLDGKQSEFDREKERLTLEDNARKTLAQIIGGLFVIGSLLLTYNTYRLSVEQLKFAQDAQLAEGLARSLSQLQSEQIVARVGALNSLEQRVKTSQDVQLNSADQAEKTRQEEHWKIVETISSFIREKSPGPGPGKSTDIPHQKAQNRAKQNEEAAKINVDIQKALNILGKRNIEMDKGKTIDLSGANLKGADLTGLNFAGANLNDTNLMNADLSGAILTGTRFNHADLRKATLTDTKLSGAFLIHAYLSDAVFSQGTLQKVDFSSANLSNARFLTKISMAEAILDGTNFTGAECTDVEGLTFEQVKDAIFNDKLPANLETDRQEILKLSKENLKSYTGPGS
jgi:uncharacterized protein YjbI with pentapeptide repeats